MRTIYVLLVVRDGDMSRMDFLDLYATKKGAIESVARRTGYGELTWSHDDVLDCDVARLSTGRAMFVVESHRLNP